MPVHLPPISRREFVKRVVLAGLGASLAPTVWAARRGETTWALMADTHIAADPLQIARGVNMAQHLETASREILGLAGLPAGAFILGDCALHSGEVEDYRTLVKLLEPLRSAGLPVHLALGNHDQRDHFRSVFKPGGIFAKAKLTQHVAVLRTGPVNWFVLDSLERTLQTPGLLGGEQLAWLAEMLDAHRKKPAIVVMHHNPNSANVTTGLKDTEQLLAILRPRRHVKAWVFGHTHVWRVETDSSGLHLVNLPPVAYVFRQGMPSGWVHARVSEEGMRLELRCIDRTHPAQGQTVELPWRTA
ncbi:MAG: metallophosphoesterase [Verrucomicrobiae bacterium]|nr:metallophosphoesterase [Verrucomicrobiae bacterium]